MAISEQEPKATIPDGLPMPRRLYSVIAITLALFSSMMNSTIANVALPTIAHNLDISAADSIWIINVYQIATIIFLLPCSAIGEIYSYKKVLLSGLTLFTIASFCCAFSTNFATLIFFRIMQGFGSAAMVSVNMTLIRLTYPKRYLSQGIGLNSTFVAISSVGGPAIASVIMSVTTWQWLFALNVPLGIFAVIFGIWALPQNPIKENRHFPKTDALLNALLFGGFTMTMEGFMHGFRPWITTSIALLTITAAIIYIPRQLKQTRPLLPFDLLRIRVFRMSIITSIASFIAQMTAMTSLPFYLQHQLHFSVSEAGLLFTAWPCVVMITAPISGFLMKKIHAGLLGGIGQMLIIIGLILIAYIDNDATKLDVVWRLMLCGAGFGLFQSPNNSVIIMSAPANRGGSASGMLATSRLLGQTTGAMLVALMFNMFSISGSRIALLIAACIATLACLLSVYRIKLTIDN